MKKFLFLALLFCSCHKTATMKAADTDVSDALRADIATAQRDWVFAQSQIAALQSKLQGLQGQANAVCLQSKKSFDPNSLHCK